MNKTHRLKEKHELITLKSHEIKIGKALRNFKTSMILMVETSYTQLLDSRHPLLNIGSPETKSFWKKKKDNNSQ